MNFIELPEISEGVVVRPLLKTEDLRLMRRAFKCYVESLGVGVLRDYKVCDDVKCRDLLTRMLRKSRV